jgi:DNA gyrase subunit B
MLASNEIKNLVIAMGTSIGDTFDIDKMRYHKIVIATDADVDGSHITTLILTLFYRYFRPVIDAGYIYIAQPPLYKIKKGKELFYAYTDEDKEKVLKGLGVQGVQEVDDSAEGESPESEEEEDLSAQAGDTKAKKNPKVSIQRYKGLGEMNAEELWETTMDPARRILKQVKVEDAEEANKVFDTLMGSEVAPRKAFIQSNAKLANLDF